MRDKKSKYDFSEAQLQRMRNMRDRNIPWHKIGEAFGVHRDVVRRRIDPEWVEERNSTWKKPNGKEAPKREWITGRAVDKMAERLREQIPEDTRNLSQILMGDPIPCRSALHQRACGGERRKAIYPETA